MQNKVDCLAAIRADLGGAYVTFDEFEVRPAQARAVANLLEVRFLSSDEIIEPDNLLVEQQEIFDQMRSDKSRCAGDEPAT
jgi:hypothetical protein